MKAKTYEQGVKDCIAIMVDLYDTYGDYAIVQIVYNTFGKRVRKLLQTKEEQQ